MSYPFVYDSGKESDLSNQSAMSHLISFDSPGHSKTALPMAMFDPLYQTADKALRELKQTTSYDSLLQYPNGGTTSGNVSPCVFSTSPNLKRHTSPRSSRGEHTSPRSSLVARDLQTAATGVKNSPIARPRPRPGQLNSYTSDMGPQPRPFSPSTTRSHRRSDISPSGSVQSLNFDYGAGGGFQSDSDATSTHSSLLDLPHDGDIPDLPLVPTPAEFGLYFEFDPSKFPW